MLKNKIRLFSIILSIMLIFTSTFVFAIDEITQTNPEASTTSEDPENPENQATDESENTELVQSEQNIKKGDTFLTGDKITIDYTIDGNLFVFANEVEVNSQIGGDAFICAKKVTINQQGYIYSNLFVIGEDVSVNGIVYDMYSVSKSLNISGYIYRDARIFCQNDINILGTIGRDAYIGYCKNIAFTSNENAETMGTISGNLNYGSEKELNIPTDQIKGSVNYSKSMANSNEENKNNIILTYISKLGSSLGLLIIVWLLGLWLAPKFLKETDKLLTKSPLPVFGIGVLGIILIPIVSLILLMLGITSTASIALILLYFVFVIISSSVSQIAIGNIVSDKFKLNKKPAQFGILILTGFIIWVISLIPVIGTIISGLLTIFGSGIILKYILPVKKEKNI